MSLIAFDTETFLITSMNVAPPLVCVSWASGGDSGICKWDHPDAYTSIRGWLEQHELVGHNVAFDFAVLCAQWPDLIPLVFRAIEEGRVHDTMLRQKLRDIALGEFRGRHRDDGTFERFVYSLADVGCRHTGERLSKGEDTYRLRYGELYRIPLEVWPVEATGYAIRDATTTLAVYLSQDADRDALMRQGWPDILHDEASQVRAAWWLELVSCWGLRVDPQKIQLLGERVMADLEGIREILLEEGLLRAEKGKFVRNTKIAAARMIDVCGWHYEGENLVPNDENSIPLRTTEKGGISLNEESCEDSGDHLLAMYARYTALSNVISKDFKALTRGYIHGSFDSLIATGRTSCRGFNTQNLRRGGGTRECFVPRPGFVFCLIDLDTAELRGFAQVCINMGLGSVMGEVINGGRDVHCYLTAQALGYDYDFVVERVAALDAEMCDARSLYKSANFGLLGGMMERRFGEMVKTQLSKSLRGKISKKALSAKLNDVLRPERLHSIREAFLDTWPEARAYLEIHARLCSHGQTACVEQYYSKRIRGGLKYSEACNTRFQGIIADAAKSAGWALSREMYTGTSVLRGSRIVNFPHDEFIVEVPEPIGHECAQAIQEIVLREVGKYLPDVPPKALPYLARYWSKKGFPIVKDGKLTPWNGEKKV